MIGPFHFICEQPIHLHVRAIGKNTCRKITSLLQIRAERNYKNTYGQKKKDEINPHTATTKCCNCIILPSDRFLSVPWPVWIRLLLFLLSMSFFHSPPSAPGTPCVPRQPFQVLACRHVGKRRQLAP
jgi:hypothetical protein